jgi:hypothetical protein
MVDASDFESFWEAYPRKVGKKAARKAWERATDKPELSIILLAVEQQKGLEQWKKDNKKWIPHPATWLNQGRWDDEVASHHKHEYRNGIHVDTNDF